MDGNQWAFCTTVGIINHHKGFFKKYSLQEAIAFLEASDKDTCQEIINCLRLYPAHQQLPLKPASGDNNDPAK